MGTDFTSGSASIFLVGATGTGKSDAGMALARALAGSGGGAILTMDAMQVYRGADIGTGKPSAAERTEIPHGGLDLVEFGASSHQRFDVAQYLKHAEAFLRDQREAGRRVIIVGGTGLYFRALTRGLCEAPQGPEELRAELAQLAVDELQARLRKIDPEMLARIDAANPRRLARAIEVFEATGRSLRNWQEETPEALVKDFTAYWIFREKKELSQRIATRVETMFAAGWVEEVRRLIAKYGLEAVRDFPGIGYREIAEEFYKTDKSYGPEAEAMELRGQARSQIEFENEATEGGAVAESATATLAKVKSDIVLATRQYAKRQLTWFAREPSLQKVMLSGTQPLSTALPFLP